ncbi:hypothetical protein [Ascidiaceihabitans sp.]|uniref:hypothetical protein n=1 Tax=Ascidiaceihabitans sp. TaxID=1872644 RepID=UPI003297AE39
MTDFDYTRSGRNRATLLTVLAVWACVTALVLWIDMALWIAAILCVATLPALYDLLTARQAGMKIAATDITWFAGAKTGKVAWNRVDHVRFDTRLDLSVRMALVLHNGRRVKVPFEATPPADAIEADLKNRDIKTERHHFGFM